MEDNYFTILWWFLPDINESDIGTHVPPHLKPPSHAPPHPIPLRCPRALTLGALLHASNLHWLSILHMVMYVSMLVSQIIPPFPPTESGSLFFTSVTPLC